MVDDDDSYEREVISTFNTVTGKITSEILFDFEWNEFKTESNTVLRTQQGLVIALDSEIEPKKFFIYHKGSAYEEYLDREGIHYTDSDDESANDEEEA